MERSNFFLIGLAGIVVAVVQPAQAQSLPIVDVQFVTGDRNFTIQLLGSIEPLTALPAAIDGNALLIEIPNAQLRSPQALENPTADIAAVEITQSDHGSILVRVEGTATAPIATTAPTPQGLQIEIAAAPLDEPPPALSTPPTSSTTAIDLLAPAENAIRIVVTGDRETYRVSESSVGTRTDADIRDVPQSIQVIPQQVIEDQGIQEIGDALRNVSGVVQAERASTPLPGISAIIRGFETTNVLRNGLRDTNARFATVEDNLAQIEVLRGPASVLFGQGNLGGTINLVTEQPLDAPTYLLEYSGGQFDFHRFAADLSSPFSPDSPLGYRLNAAYESLGSYRDFERAEQFFVAPTVQLIATESTDLLIDLEYFRFDAYETAPELPASGTVLDNPNGEVDRSANLGEPSLVGGEESITRLGYRFEHRFNSDWRIRNEFLLSRRESEGVGVTPIEDIRTEVRLEEGLRTMRRLLTINPSEQTSITLNTSLAGRFDTWNIEHQVLVGVELLSDHFEDRVEFDTLDPIDIFEPEYRPDSRRPLAVFQDGAGETVSVGFYLQDQITIRENLILLLGGRFDIAHQTSQDFLDEDLSFEQTDQAFSPRIGMVYRPVEPISLYASYAQSFLPVNGRETSVDAAGQRVVGDPFQPERGQQYEIGIKADISDQITATLALYSLERTNVVAQSGDRRSQFQVGTQRSRGIELDLVGEILPGWQIITGYAYTDARVVEDDRIEVGNRLANVPEHAVNLWTSYEIQSGALQGLGFGIGFFYQSDREVAAENLFRLPSFLRTDAAIFYRRDQLQVSLNVQNLFDVEYYPAGRDFVRVIPGQPFTVVGRVSWEF